MEVGILLNFIEIASHLSPQAKRHFYAILTSCAPWCQH
jgi:hypothetical protein